MKYCQQLAYFWINYNCIFIKITNTCLRICWETHQYIEIHRKVKTWSNEASSKFIFYILYSFSLCLSVFSFENLFLSEIIFFTKNDNKIVLNCILFNYLCLIFSIFRLFSRTHCVKNDYTLMRNLELLYQNIRKKLKKLYSKKNKSIKQMQIYIILEIFCDFEKLLMRKNNFLPPRKIRKWQSMIIKFNEFIKW